VVVRYVALASERRCQRQRSESRAGLALRRATTRESNQKEPGEELHTGDMIGHDIRVNDVRIPQYHELMWPALQATKELGGSATVREMNERAMAQHQGL
jgi:hypothetical protein